MAYETFDFTKILHTVAAIKAMRDESDAKKLQQQYMANAENRAQGAFDMQAQKFGNEQTQFSQEQQLKNTKFANAYFKMMADDPSTASYAVDQMKRLGIIDPNFDVSTQRPEDIQQLAAQQYKQTSSILQSLNPQAPIAVSEGTVLLDPATKQPVFSNPKQPAEPSSFREYEKAKEQGYTGTYLDYQKELKKSGASQVNINPPFEDARLKAQQEAMGKSLVNDMYAGAKNDAKIAIKTNQKLGMMEKLLDNGLKTGKFTAFLAEGANFLTSMGMAPETAKEFARDAQTFNAAAMDLVLQQQLLQKGPQTESDAKRLEASVAGIEKTSDANRLLIAFAKAQNNRNIEYAHFLDKWARQNNGDLYGADEAWANGPGSRSLFDEPVLKPYAGIGKKAANKPKFLGFE